MNITTKGVYKLRSSRARPNWYTNEPRGSVLRGPTSRQHYLFRLDEKTWEEMGRPEIITVTVEPGDQLNARA